MLAMQWIRAILDLKKGLAVTGGGTTGCFCIGPNLGPTSDPLFGMMMARTGVSSESAGPGAHLLSTKGSGL